MIIFLVAPSHPGELQQDELESAGVVWHPAGGPSVPGFQSHPLHPFACCGFPKKGVTKNAKTNNFYQGCWAIRKARCSGPLSRIQKNLCNFRACGSLTTSMWPAHLAKPLARQGQHPAHGGTWPLGRRTAWRFFGFQAMEAEKHFGCVSCFQQFFRADPRGHRARRLV